MKVVLLSCQTKISDNFLKVDTQIWNSMLDRGLAIKYKMLQQEIFYVDFEELEVIINQKISFSSKWVNYWKSLKFFEILSFLKVKKEIKVKSNFDGYIITFPFWNFLCVWINRDFSRVWSETFENANREFHNHRLGSIQKWKQRIWMSWVSLVLDEASVLYTNKTDLVKQTILRYTPISYQYWSLCQRRVFLSMPCDSQSFLRHTKWL